MAYNNALIAAKVPVYGAGSIYLNTDGTGLSDYFVWDIDTSTDEKIRSVADFCQRIKSVTITYSGTVTMLKTVYYEDPDYTGEGDPPILSYVKENSTWTASDTTIWRNIGDINGYFTRYKDQDGVVAAVPVSERGLLGGRMYFVQAGDDTDPRTVGSWSGTYQGSPSATPVSNSGTVKSRLNRNWRATVSMTENGDYEEVIDPEFPELPYYEWVPTDIPSDEMTISFDQFSVGLDTSPSGAGLGNLPYKEGGIYPCVESGDYEHTTSINPPISVSVESHPYIGWGSFEDINSDTSEGGTQAGIKTVKTGVSTAPTITWQLYP